ncbi:hypothetical protein EDC94DRAFT_18086 [Helicostylum pulchrum]|uniref:F-box domain-containing protein n=1 Tax=Helicostylum pulchrum TaxID=562976 RepID=A0ABP9Y7M7_9FUNG|nr:hypothetical protein EDC94DRAFT_18086 [Helicostylum pulchrum]
MRIFWFNTESTETPMTLLYSNNPPTRQLLFPPEIVKKIIDYLPRSSLPCVSHVSQLWYATAMPILYKHIYIRTLPHWVSVVKTVSNPHFQFGSHITSLVLKPSPKLISAQLTSYLNQTVVANDDQLQPSTRGYVRLERVNYDLTGLEGIDTPMSDEQAQAHENYVEMDDTEKEYEWLTLVTTDQMVSVVSQCPRLEYLYISGCEKLQDDVLVRLANAKRKYSDHARPLQGIWISLLRDLTPFAIHSLLQFEKTQFGTSSLRHLDLGYNMNMSQQSLEKLIVYWGSTLTHIRLDTIYEVSDQVVTTIAAHCTKLRLLHVSRCWNITNSSMRVLSSSCKQLRYVSLAFLNQVDEIGIRHLVHSLPELEWLNITGCGINPLFKPLVLESFANYRRQHALKPIYMQDGNVNLI